MPHAGDGCYNIIYADDTTQVITIPDKDKQFLTRITKYEIDKLNRYERTSKIQTNLSKFKVIPVRQMVPLPLRIDGRDVAYARDGVLLGLHISKFGYSAHITRQINKAKQSLMKLYRFKNLSSQKKRILYLSLVQSITEYPPIPVHALSKSQLHRLQKIQTSGARFISGATLGDRYRTEDLLHMANLQPLSGTLNLRAAKTWLRVGETNRNLMARLLRFPCPTHPCFPRSLLHIRDIGAGNVDLGLGN